MQVFTLPLGYGPGVQHDMVLHCINCYTYLPSCPKDNDSLLENMLVCYFFRRCCDHFLFGHCEHARLL